jgi:ATP-dependent helicase/nuclease subunit A
MFDRNTVVLASAGTGKTRKLVEVYIELLERGIDPMRIAAVTFTEKAAAEMRDRIRTALYGKPGQWMRPIGLLPVAPISTIHGFCGILLREQGFEAGLDPAFTILDEQRSLDLARESAKETIRQEIRSGNESVEQLFGDFGFEGLVDAVVSAGYWLNSLGADGEWLKSRIDDQRRAATEIEKEIAEDLRPFGGADFQRIGEIADELEGKKARHSLRKRDDPYALLPRIGQIAGVSAAERLSQLVIQSAEKFLARKRAVNASDFDDLLLGVRNLLKNDARIRRHYQNRFQALLVDEFQDTDEVQAEIISLLAEDPACPGRLAPQKLMIVGDPKQSIYRFRRARVTVFFRMLERIRNEGGAVEHLQENYRSAAPIVEFSNLLCDQMMDGRGKLSDTQQEGIDFSYRVRFSAEDRLKPKSDAEFLGITYVAAEEGARAAQGREMEAEAIARLLKQWKSEGRIQSWREVALLMRAMTNVEIYLSALEAHGIPVYVVQGTAFYQKSEVSDLIAFLELVLHPADNLLRATVLSSSLFGITFKDLLSAGRGAGTGGLFDDLVAQWSARRDTATAAEILQDVIRKTSYDVVMMAQKNGPQRVANIGKLIEITRELARQGATALDDDVRYLRDRAHDTSVRESEAQIVSQSDEVVRILTIHQAKGLEFDIVIIPDLAARTGRSSGDRIFFSDRWGLLVGAAYGLHRKPLPHALMLQEKRWEDDQQYEEEKRLLYVAVTRARKMLVLGEGFSKQAGPWLQWIGQVFDKVNSSAIETARGGKSQTVKFKGFSVKVLPASQLNVPEQLAFSTDAILVGEPDIPRPRKLRMRLAVDMTPSELGALDGCFRFFHWTRILGMSEPGSEASGNSSQLKLGSIAHKFLEAAIKPSKADLSAAGVPDLESVFDASEWRDLADTFPERELPFIMHLDVDRRDCWVRGRMDAAVAGDIPRVIDYKYALWRELGETAYDVQMTAYALALMKAIGTDRAISELWYLKAPMKIIRREYARDEAEGKLSGLFARYLDALDSNEWPPADRAYCDRVQCGFRERCWGRTGRLESQDEG